MNGIRAEFNGTTLSITVPRRAQTVDRSSAPVTLPSEQTAGKKGASAGFLAARRPRTASTDNSRMVVGSPMSVTQSAPDGARGEITSVVQSRPHAPRLQRNPTQVHQSALQSK